MLEEFIRKIPNDVIRENIIPYTYQPQTKELCYDIRNYFEVTTYLLRKYKEIYKDWYSNEDKEWLLHDIQRFMNEDKPTFFGYVDFYVQFFQRIYMLRDLSRDQVIDFIKSTKYFYFTRKIFQNIGIMQPHEREQLKLFFNQIYPHSMI